MRRMVRKAAISFLLLAAVCLSASICRADLFYEQICQLNPVGANQPQEPKRMRVYVRKQMVRVEDLSSDRVIIVRLDKGIIWAIDNASRTYREIGLKELSEEWRAARKAAGIDESGGEVEVKRGDDDRKIISYPCKHYRILEGGKVVLELWVAESLDVPEKNDLYDYSERLGEFSPAVLEAARRIKGFPLRMKAVKYVGAARVSAFREVTSLNRDRIPEGKFEIPEGYSPVAK